MVEKESEKNDKASSGAPFETVTLAEIFINQGYLAKGLEIYRKLSRFEPDNQEFRKKIIELDARIKEEGPVAATAEKVSRPSPSAQKSVGGQNQRAPKNKNRVLEILNKWLNGARKRKKHVQ